MNPKRLTLLALVLSTLTAQVGCGGGSPEQSTDEGAMVADDDDNVKATTGATFVVNSAANTFTVVAPNEQGFDQPVFASYRVDGDLVEAIAKVRKVAPEGLDEFEPRHGRCESTNSDKLGAFFISNGPSGQGFRYWLVRKDVAPEAKPNPNAPDAARFFWGTARRRSGRATRRSKVPSRLAR